MNRIKFALVAGASALAVLALAPATGARVHSTRAQTVTVTMSEFKFVLAPKTVRAGAVAFKLVNKGKLAHDFKIGGKTSAKIQPGKKGALVVTLKKGKYPYLCTVPGHAAAGMKGVLAVS